MKLLVSPLLSMCVCGLFFFFFVFNIRNYYIISHQLCFLFFFIYFVCISIALCSDLFRFAAQLFFLSLLFVLHIYVYINLFAPIYIYIYYIEIYSLIRSSRKTCTHIYIYIYVLYMHVLSIVDYWKPTFDSTYIYRTPVSLIRCVHV